MKVTCVLVVVFAVFQASALSIDNGFNVNGGCDNNIPPTAVQSQIIDAFQYRLLDILTKQASDSAKAALKPQIRKELFSVSPVKRFSQPFSPLTQTIPFNSARNFELPSLQFYPGSTSSSSSGGDSIISGLLGEEQPRTGIFSTNRQGSVNIERSIGGVLGGGSYPEVLNESFLGNSNGALAGIGSSFLGNGGFLEESRPGITNGYSNQGY